MLDFIESLRGVIEFYPILSLIILSLIGSETVIFLAFLSGAGYFSLPVWLIFIVGLLAVIILDYIYYRVGKFEFLKKMYPEKLHKKKYNTFFNYVKSKTHDNIFMLLLISKFFYGFRQMVTLYFGYHKLKYREFFKKDSIALIIYFTIMIPLAWFLGNEIGASFSDVEQLEKILMIGIFVLIFIYIIGRIIISKITNKFS